MSSKTKYPIFEDCKKYTLDVFWIDVFERCSKGKFPEGVSYDSSGFLLLEKEEGKVVKKYENSLLLFKEIKNYLMGKGIMSPKEIVIKKVGNPLDEVTSWDNIKSRTIKEELVSGYIDWVFDDLPKQKKLFKFLEIMSLIQSKNITSEDIKIERGKISNINIPDQNNVTSERNPFPVYEYQKRKNILTEGIRAFSNERKNRLFKDVGEACVQDNPGNTNTPK